MIKNAPKNFAQNKVSCIVTSVLSNKLQLYVIQENKPGICKLADISDYPVKNLKDHFKVGEKHYFMMKKDQSNPAVVNLSYKLAHPEEMIKKNKPVDTFSYYKNLRLQLNKWIMKEKTNNN